MAFRSDNNRRHAAVVLPIKDVSGCSGLKRGLNCGALLGCKTLVLRFHLRGPGPARASRWPIWRAGNGGLGTTLSISEITLQLEMLFNLGIVIIFRCIIEVVFCCEKKAYIS